MAAILIQIGTNLANDVFDFQRGADTSERLGPPRVTQSGLIPAEQMRAGAYAAFVAAALIGLYLVAVGGWPILLIGAFCILSGLGYTAGPLPLGYLGLGDPLVFICFGMLGVFGTYYLQMDEVRAGALIAAIPVGLIVTAVLVVNNLRDTETDRRAGKLTLAIRLGDRLSRIQYALFVLGAYALLPTVLLADAGPWLWLPVLTLPVAWGLCRAVLAGATGRALNPILKRTAQLHLAFGSLLALGLIL